MLSDVAKAEIIGAVVGCFVVSLVLLVCLVCPCPLRAAVTACIERRQGWYKKPQHSRSSDAPGAECPCCFGNSCCQFDEEVEYHKSSCSGNQQPDVGQQAVIPTTFFSQAAKPALAVAAAAAWPDARAPGAELAPRVALTFSVTRLPDCLAVHLHSAEGTPGPRLGLCHCNFALVTTIACGGALPEADFDFDAVRTGVVGQTASPVFNETLVLPLAAEEADGLRLLVRCLDYDRFSRERIVGEVRVPLPAEIDRTVEYTRLLMELPQTEAGELLVALQYMPTVERLSVIVLKANDIYAPDGAVPTTYLQLELLSAGSLVYKKRSRIFEASPRPVYNESISMDLPSRRLDRVSLIVSVMNCYLRHSFRADLDSCLGYVVLSSSCFGSGRAHWLEMANRPRNSLACWHRLA